MTANGPIKAGDATVITEMGFVADPQFPAITTPYGHVDFLQIVGISAAELQEGKRWNLRGLLDALKPHMPLWVTDIQRAILHALPPREASEMLISKARQRARGGGDNLSLALARIDSPR